MNYRSIADLNKAIKSWIPELPSELDLIVGIPRSGLLAASLLSLYLDLPLTDVDGLCEGRILAVGRRYGGERISDLWQRKLKVLVVDDSINSGTEMRKVKARIEKAGLPHEIYYAAVYASPEGHRYVDYWYEIVDTPRVFEWNVMHHHILLNSCVDIDGVLCRDPKPDENDDGERYLKFLTTVKPLIVPTKPIGWLVTCRLEKYRKVTEEWLQRYGIQYNQLIMMDLPDKETRIALGAHAEFKAQVYKAVDAVLFIESSYSQAQVIARLAGKPVLCIETGQMINPNFVFGTYTRGRKFAAEAISDPLRALYKLLRFVKRKFSVLWWRISARAKKKDLRFWRREHG